MPHGVWSSAAGDVEPVGHNGAALAFPMSNPLETVSFEDAASVNVEGDAVAAPLLQPPLSLGVRSSAASEASLGVPGVLYVMLALPVPVGAFGAWEVYWAVRSKALLASRRCAAV